MKMDTHSFSIVGALPPAPAHDLWVSDDSHVRVDEERVHVEFTRSAATHEEAIESALADMRRRGIRIIRIDV
jgi:hypothetical protein